MPVGKNRNDKMPIAYFRNITLDRQLEYLYAENERRFLEIEKIATILEKITAFLESSKL